MIGYKSLKNTLLSATAIAGLAIFGSGAAHALVISTGDVQATEFNAANPPTNTQSVPAPTTADPTIDGALRVGDTLSGQIDVTAGSTLQVNEFAGSVTGADGGPFSGARIHLGDQGTGVLNLLGGSTVNVTALTSSDGASLSISNIPGNTTGGPSAAGFLDANNSTVNVTAANFASFNVGRDGSGTADIENGSTLTVSSTGATSNAVIAVGQFSHGTTPGSTLSLDGAGTTATINTNQNALLFVGDEAKGTMFVTNNATVQMNGVRDNVIQVGDNIGGDGDLQIRSGGSVNGTFALIGDDVGAVGSTTIYGAGSSLQLTGKDSVDNRRAGLIIGDEGTGTVNVANGGSLLVNGATEPGRASVINLGGTLGTTTVNGNGTLNVDGSGSQVRLASDGLAFVQVGRNGTGALNVTNGGSVVVDDPDKFGLFRVGRLAGSNGTVTVDGTGSSVTAARESRVGEGGNGILNIQNGGTFQTSRLFAAQFANSDSQINVTGAGSTLNLFGTDDSGNGPVILVGMNDRAVLNVTNGGTVNTSENGETVTGLNGGFLIGETSTTTGIADGVVRVDGAGSTINVGNSNASMQVGRNGAGRLEITNGAKVTNAPGNALSIIGRTASSTGTAIVTGTGSEWQAGSHMFLGRMSISLPARRSAMAVWAC